MMMRMLLIALCLAPYCAAWGDETALPEPVTVAPATAETPRNTEGDIVELHDGRLWLVYTRFSGGTEDDHAAELYGMTSTDQGRTWSEPQLVRRSDAKQNIMSVSLLRLQSGGLMLGYLRKNSDRDDQFLVCRSTDEGQTWSEPVVVTEPVSYYVVNNDRLVQLKGGRLLVPAADHGDISRRPNSPAVCYYSDDEGKTWTRGAGEVRLSGIGCQEPGIVELADGRVYMIIRNSLGTIYRAISSDGGATWGEPTSTGLTAPVAPASISRMPDGGLLMVWNDSPEGRVPLTAAVSRDEGETWTRVGNLEVEGQSYAYTSITWVGDTALLSYWTQTPEGYGLKVRRVPLGWFAGR